MSTVVAEFEKEFCKVMGVEDAIAVNSGTSALIAALWSLDLKGKFVITTPFTYQATINAITIAGGMPVFCDIREDNHLIDETKIENLVTDRTVAILPVHLFGRVCDMDAIWDIANKYNLRVIEDTAQALFAKDSKGRLAGTMSDVGCFSFYRTKNLSTFEGGMITSSLGSKMDMKKIRAITNQGQTEPWNFQYLGFNFRMPEPCALIGLNALQNHRVGAEAELGRLDEKDGAYPFLVYQTPVYKHWAQYFKCPVAEKVAKEIGDELIRKGVDSRLWTHGEDV
jgi:dTDP-4-amino-4,6-dideoxygalactose transaminase